MYGESRGSAHSFTFIKKRSIMVAERTVSVVKHNKYVGAIACAFLLTVTAGCYEPLDITEEELDMVAEYAAGVLVKHGTQTTEALLNRKEQEEAWLLLATPTPRPTVAPEKDEQSKAEEEKPDVTTKPTVTDKPGNTELIMKDLNELLGKDGFEFQYTGYKITPLYQGAGDLFAAAGEGKRLVVLEFEVLNQSSVKETLTLNKGAAKEFVFTLHIGSKTVKPSLTLLQEDFYTSYEAVYEPGEKKKGVLVFECPENVVTEDMTLAVLRDVDGKEDSVLVKVK